MITKKQWAQFCIDVQKAKSSRLEPHIHNKRVVGVNLFDNIITTSCPGEPKTIYTIESVNTKTLRQLYALVELTHVRLYDLKQITVYDI